MLKIFLLFCVALPLLAQPSGKAEFESRCSVCHGSDGMGGELGPAIVRRIATRSDAEIATIIHEGRPGSGMPPSNLPQETMNQLVAYLRTFRMERRRAAKPRLRVSLSRGGTLEGLELNRSANDLQLRTTDGRIHLLRKDGETYREVTSQSDWGTYNGDTRGNRFVTAKQIDKNNVAKLATKWIFSIPNVSTLEVTPVVQDGVMYVTSANQCFALDAGSGRELWHYERPRTRGLVGNAASGINRGVALAGDKVFMVTDHAHLLALNRSTGALVWDTEMADWHLNYNATSAPLVVGKLVITGTAGGEQGARGFIGAYDQETGKEVWRTWTVPRPGEPGSETWKGEAIEHPSAVAWFTGSYDPELDLIYWPTGNPGPDYNDAERGGDNLYSCSVLALDAKTGKMRWYYQFTPHDVYDWDATEPLVLVDAQWEGKPRKLLLQANRNGFFYVLDRADGKLLLGEQFVRNLNWAKGIGKDGRPILNPPQKVGNSTRVCPSQSGATNWYSTAYDPASGHFFVQTLENCNLYAVRPAQWEAGRSYLGGSSRSAPDVTPQKFLRAIDIHTGKMVWELPQVGDGRAFGGVMATAGGLVFFCDDSGMFLAADASNGKPLWKIQTSQTWRASPMSYVFDNRQFVAVAAGQNILAFGLPD